MEVSTGGTHYPLTTWSEGFFDFQVKLPEAVQCEQCIFQVSARCPDSRKKGKLDGDNLLGIDEELIKSHACIERTLIR